MRTVDLRRPRVRLAVSLTSMVVALAASASLAVAAAVTGAAITIASGACTGGGSAFCFNPETATSAVGAQVTWTNTSGVGHTATLCTPSACPGAPTSTGANSFNVTIGSGSGAAGAFTFTSAGTYHYYCAIHGYALMHGTITVASAPASPSPSPASATPRPATPRAAPGSATTPNTGGAPGWEGWIVILAGTSLVVLAFAGTGR